MTGVKTMFVSTVELNNWLNEAASRKTCSKSYIIRELLLNAKAKSDIDELLEQLARSRTAQ